MHPDLLGNSLFLTGRFEAEATVFKIDRYELELNWIARFGMMTNVNGG